MRSKPGFSRPCRCLSHLGGNVDRSIAPLGSRQGTDVLEDRRKIASKSRGKICLTVHFHLHAPWPDFMTFYGTTATAAGIVVPKHYLEQVGEDGCKHHPIGLGPYCFIRHTPGVVAVLEAYEGYWRHVPHVNRVIFKGVPEDTTRLAMLKKGEADIAIAFLDGAVAQEAQRDPRLTLSLRDAASLPVLGRV